jgi:hypothetical protein
VSLKAVENFEAAKDTSVASGIRTMLTTSNRTIAMLDSLPIYISALFCNF